MPSAEKLQASNSSQLEAIRGGLLTYDSGIDFLIVMDINYFLKRIWIFPPSHHF